MAWGDRGGWWSPEGTGWLGDVVVVSSAQGGMEWPWNGTRGVREVQRDKAWLVIPRGTPVVPRGSWGGCRCPGNVVVASSDQGYTGMARGRGQQWPARLRGAGDSQGCHKDTVKGWQCPRGHGCLGKTWSNWHHPGGPEGGWDAAEGPGELPLTIPPCPQEELQAWLQGLSTAIMECRGSRGKAQSLPLPLPIPPAPPEAPLPRKDKEKRFSFFPKKK